MGVSAKADWVLLNSLDDFSELVFLRAFSQLLGQVVPKWIIHQLHKVVYCVDKDLVDNIFLVFIYFLL